MKMFRYLFQSQWREAARHLVRSNCDAAMASMISISRRSVGRVVSSHCFQQVITVTSRSLQLVLEGKNLIFLLTLLFV